MRSNQDLVVGNVDDVTIELTRDEHEQLSEVVDGLIGRLPGAFATPAAMDNPEYLTEVELAAEQLPRRLAVALREFRRYGNEHGTLVIRNLPIGTNPIPTPADGAVADWADVAQATVAQLAVVSCLGDVIAYADEKSGRLVQDVIPVQGAERRQENSGSVLLEMHTEDGFHPFKPDYLTMLCLRPDHERIAQTTSSSVLRALPLLSPEARDALYRPEFVLHRSSSFGGPGDAVPSPIAVLSGPVESPGLVADFHAMEPLTENGKQAFQDLYDALLAVMAGMVLVAGDLMVVDNRKAVHGRTSFVPRYDGNDRWLRRSFAVRDLTLSRGARPATSHVCRPLK